MRPVLSPFPGEQHNRIISEIQVIDVQPGRLRNPGPCPVEKLEQRAVPQHARVGILGGPGRLKQSLHLIDVDRLGQPFRLGRRRHLPRRIVAGEPLLDGEAMQPAHRYDRASHRTGGKRLMLLIAGAQRGAKLRDVYGGHVGELPLPARAKHLGVPAQIPRIRLDGIGRQPALDHQVLQVLPHCVANTNHAADTTRGPAASCCYQRAVNYRAGRGARGRGAARGSRAPA